MGTTIANESNTAYNVSVYWNYSSDFSNLTDINLSYVNISNSSLNTNTLVLDFADLASATSGIKTFYLNSYGYNLSGNLIEDANNLTLLTDAINITFLCYNTSDGVCVTACGYIQDADCTSNSSS